MEVRSGACRPYVKVSLSARVESNLSMRERRGLRERVHCDFII